MYLLPIAIIIIVISNALTKQLFIVLYPCTESIAV